MTGELVILVNRTCHPLTVLRNGQTRILQPGENPITHEWVRFAKFQNPRKGTFTPASVEGDYLVGVKGVDDCDMLSPEQENLDKPDKFDRSADEAQGKVVEIVQTGERAPRRLTDPVPADTMFSGRN